MFERSTGRPQGEIEAEVAKFRHELEPLAAAILALDFPRPPPALPDYAQGILSEEAAAKRRQLCAAENVRAPRRDGGSPAPARRPCWGLSPGMVS